MVINRLMQPDMHFKALLYWAALILSLAICHYLEHYNDVIMGAVAYQITSLTIVYSNVYTDADQRKHQSSASLAFVRRIPRTNGQ